MSALEQIAELVRRETGIEVKPAQLRSLSATLERAAPGAPPEAVLRELGHPTTGRALLERVIDEVTVNESFFFRHVSEVQAIDWRALLEGARAEGRSAVRLWSAASAAGEEAFTLAILAAEAFGSMQPPVKILGTDISYPILERARRARYHARAVREVPAALRERYLQPVDGVWTVVPSLRRLVEFRRHNLAQDPAPPLGEGRFDVILCRNVLIYFDAKTVERTYTALEGALTPQGLLIMGAADRLCGSALPRPGDRSRVPRRPAREPVTPAPKRLPRARRVEQVRKAVEEWSLEATIGQADSTLADDPLDIDAYFVRGVAQLACDDAAGAVVSLRRALYLDPLFGLAAFKLARAQDALGEKDAARRTYARALKLLAADDARSRALADNVSLADVVHACTTRIAVLAQPRS